MSGHELADSFEVVLNLFVTLNHPKLEEKRLACLLSAFSLFSPAVPLSNYLSVLFVVGETQKDRVL